MKAENNGDDRLFPEPAPANGAVSLRELALLALRHGINPLPPKQDGSKAPRPIKVGPDWTWKPYQERLVTVAEVERWYGPNTGIGFVTGAISGHLELFEFDCAETYARFKDAADKLGLGDIVQAIETCYLEKTPGGGYHWLYRCPPALPSEKLARRHKTPDEYDDRDNAAIAEAQKHGRSWQPVRVLIETKGEGGYVVAAPSYGSVHPTRKPYILLAGGIDKILTLTPGERAALWQLAQTFDEMPEEVTLPTAQARYERPAGDKKKPGTDFNERGDWASILAGWTPVFARGTITYWRRPGKSKGHSATTGVHGHDILHVFTSSTVLKPGTNYSKFAAFAALEHAGDFSSAAKALAAQGFGDQPRTRAGGSQTPPGAQQQHDQNANGHAGAGTGATGSQKPRIDFRTMSEADLGMVRFSDIVSRPVVWLWKYRLKVGSMALMAGMAGEGKSTILLNLASLITTGGPWPDGSGNAPLGDVIILSAEDNPEDTLKPRFIAMGGDINRITLLRAKYVIRRPGKQPEVHPTSLQDLDWWDGVFYKRPECKLLIVDPLPSYLGRGVNDSKNAEIRQVLEPFLHTIIEPSGMCMLCNTHLNKSVDIKTPVHRISGSHAYGDIPRNVHIVARDPDDTTKQYFKQVKCNNAPWDLPALSYKLEQVDVVADTGEPMETSKVVFDGTPVHIDMEDIMTRQKEKKKPAPKLKTQECAVWLLAWLKDRPEPQHFGTVINAAGEAGFAGTIKDDGRWSNPQILYRGKDAIPNLPAPDDGWEVLQSERGIGRNGKPIPYWQIARMDGAAGGEERNRNREPGDDDPNQDNVPF